jgi:hypothetical protein
MSRFGTRLSAAWSAITRSDLVLVAKSAFTQAFLTGRDVTGLDFSQGKLIKPYEQSAWINRAIQLKVDEILRVPLKFYDGDVEFTDPAFAAWWQSPFLTASGRAMSLIEVRKELASWPDLGGEFFIILGDDWLNPFAARSWGALSRPIIARPDKMRHVVQQGKIIGWVFTDAGAQQHSLLPEQVIHAPLWNPYDDFRGLATVKVVMNAAEADYLAGLYIRNLMRNNGDQGVYVIAKSGVIDDVQREQIIASLREKRMRALRGDFSAAFLTGDISVEDPKAQAPDGALSAGRVLSQQEVFLGLGVPPSMATVKASYSIGADSDRFTLITGTSMPLSHRVDAALAIIAGIQLGRVRLVNGQWTPTGKPIVAESDWDDHPVIQQVRRERIDSAIKLWGTGMSMKVANEYLDLGMQAFPGWDRGYLPFSVAAVSADGEVAPASPAQELDDPAESPEFSETDEDDSVKALRLLVLGRRRMEERARSQETARVDAEFAMFACSCHDCAEVSQRANRSPAELAHWRTLIAKRRTTVKSFQSAIGRVLMQARIETLRKIETWHKDAKSIETKAGAAEHLLFDLSKFSEKLLDAIEGQEKSGLQVAGAQLLGELGRDDVFKMPPAQVLEYLQGRQNKLSNVPQEMFDRLKASLEEGLKAGDTQDQLSGRVKKLFNDINDGQARTISLTETGACYGAGRHAAMKQAGVQFKAWLTSGLPNIRPAHLQAGLDYPSDRGIPIDEPFIVDGEELDHPGDEEGSAGNVINCHCISIAVAAPQEEKRRPEPRRERRAKETSPITVNVAAPVINFVPPAVTIPPESVKLDITLNQPPSAPREVRHIRDELGRISKSVAEEISPPAKP